MAVFQAEGLLVNEHRLLREIPHDVVVGQPVSAEDELIDVRSDEEGRCQLLPVDDNRKLYGSIDDEACVVDSEKRARGGRDSTRIHKPRRGEADVRTAVEQTVVVTSRDTRFQVGSALRRCVY